MSKVSMHENNSENEDSLLMLLVVFRNTYADK